MRSVAPHGKAASVDTADVARDMVTLRAKLRDYELQNIYNVYETGLFLDFFPDEHTYAHMKTRNRFVVSKE